MLIKFGHVHLHSTSLFLFYMVAMFLQGIILSDKKSDIPDKSMASPVIGAFLIIIASILTKATNVNFYALVAVVIGGLINLFSLINIGKNFSARVQPSSGHFLVTSGIYKFIRHPRYLGLSLLHFGLAISINHLLAFTGFLTCLIGFLFRVNIEEEHLARLYGHAWFSYVQNSWKLIPFIF